MTVPGEEQERPAITHTTYMMQSQGLELHMLSEDLRTAAQICWHSKYNPSESLTLRRRSCFTLYD